MLVRASVKTHRIGLVEIDQHVVNLSCEVLGRPIHPQTFDRVGVLIDAGGVVVANSRNVVVHSHELAAAQQQECEEKV